MPMRRRSRYWHQKRLLTASIFLVCILQFFSYDIDGRLHVGIGSNIGKPSMIVVTNTSINTTLQHTTPKQRPCYIIAENKADYHYEVIESALMQYPLPWDTFNCNKEETIADVAPAKYHVATNEKEQWVQYFKKHLSGKVRSRTNGDGAIIHFGEIQEMGSNYPHSYDATIGISCDSFNYIQWLKSFPKLYCVLHGTAPKEALVKYKDRVCWVNPTHPCYFVPSDLPQFPRRRFRKDGLVRLCVKNYPVSSLQFLVNAVQSYEHKGEIAIVLMGRMETIKEVFGNISDLVSYGGDADYYRFEENMSRCHALLPLIHPWEETHKKYFPWSGAGKLSGYMSQAIGLKIPLLVHEEIRDLYQKHLTAPAWTYTTQNINDIQSFQNAFRTMMKELLEYHTERYSRENN